MAVKVKRIVLWRKDVENRPGSLAAALEPLAKAGASLQVVMGYRYPGQHERAVIEVHPIATKKGATAAQQAGLSPAALPALMVEGDDSPGLGSRIAGELAEGGINMVFLVSQVIGRRFSAIFGFESEDDTVRAAGIIRRAAKGTPKRAR